MLFHWFGFYRQFFKLFIISCACFEQFNSAMLLFFLQWSKIRFATNYFLEETNIGNYSRINNYNNIHFVWNNRALLSQVDNVVISVQLEHNYWKQWLFVHCCCKHQLLPLKRLIHDTITLFFSFFWTSAGC